MSAPLRSMVADPPIQTLPSAGSEAGGGSPTPGPGDTSFMDIADNGMIMPPKTTWFEPKLRSGLVIHSLD